MIVSMHFTKHTEERIALSIAIIVGSMILVNFF